MEVMQFLLLEGLFFSAFSYVIFTGIVGDDLYDLMRGVFFAGAIGWGIAFFTLLYPLVFAERVVIFFISNRLDSLAVGEYQNRWEVLLLTPIFTSVFEEVTRYFSIRHKTEMASDRSRSPFIFGLGWGTAETLVVIGLGAVGAFYKGTLIDVTALTLLATLVERGTAFGLYIGLSYLIFYTKYDEHNKFITVALAVILHFLYGFLSILWFSIFSLESSISFWGFESSLLLFTVALLFWVKRFIVPRGEVLVQQYLKSTTPET